MNDESTDSNEVTIGLLPWCGLNKTLSLSF